MRLITLLIIAKDLDNMLKFTLDWMNGIIYDDDQNVMKIVAEKNQEQAEYGSEIIISQI